MKKGFWNTHRIGLLGGLEATEERWQRSTELSDRLLHPSFVITAVLLSYTSRRYEHYQSHGRGLLINRSQGGEAGRNLPLQAPTKL